MLAISNLGYASSVSTLVAFYPAVSKGMKEMIKNEVELWCKQTGWWYEVDEKGNMNLLPPDESAPKKSTAITDECDKFGLCQS